MRVLFWMRRPKGYCGGWYDGIFCEVCQTDFPEWETYAGLTSGDVF